MSNTNLPGEKSPADIHLEVRDLDPSPAGSMIWLVYAMVLAVLAYGVWALGSSLAAAGASMAVGILVERLWRRRVCSVMHKRPGGAAECPCCGKRSGVWDMPAAILAGVILLDLVLLCITFHGVVRWTPNTRASVILGSSVFLGIAGAGVGGLLLFFGVGLGYCSAPPRLAEVIRRAGIYLAGASVAIMLIVVLIGPALLD